MDYLYDTFVSFSILSAGFNLVFVVLVFFAVRYVCEIMKPKSDITFLAKLNY